MDQTGKPKKTIKASGLSVADVMFYVGLGMVAAGAGFIAALMIPESSRLHHTGFSAQREADAALPHGTFVVAAAPAEVPSLVFMGADGKRHELSEWRGKVLLLNLWATWCGPCKLEMPSLDRLQAKLGGGGFTVLALSVDQGGIDKPAAFFSGNGITHLAVYNDAEFTAAGAFRTSGLPLSVIIDAQGREIARLIGPADWDSPENIAKVEEFIKTGGAAR